MKYTVTSETLGKIVYEESFTGKRFLTLNGIPLEKTGKKTFRLPDGHMAAIIGSALSGAKLDIAGGEKIQLTPPLRWYEYVLALFIPAFILAWGNSPTLVNILPLIGGVIGGAISGLFAALSLAGMKYTKNILLKIVISLGCFAVAILICYLLALLLLAAAQGVQGAAFLPMAGRL